MSCPRIAAPATAPPCTHARALERAAALGVTGIETIVLASNVGGLAVAARWGYEEIERELLPGDTVPFVLLRRTLPLPLCGS